MCGQHPQGCQEQAGGNRHLSCWDLLTPSGTSHIYILTVVPHIYTSSPPSICMAQSKTWDLQPAIPPPCLYSSIYPSTTTHSSLGIYRGPGCASTLYIPMTQGLGQHLKIIPGPPYSPPDIYRTFLNDCSLPSLLLPRPNFATPILASQDVNLPMELSCS